MEINYAMNQMQAEKLFAAEAVFMCSADVVPEYRVIELFGDDMARWLDSCCVHESRLNAWRKIAPIWSLVCSGIRVGSILPVLPVGTVFRSFIIRKLLS